MSWKLYVLPLVGAGTRADPRRPAYLAANGVTDFALFDYGASPWALVAADTTDQQDAAIDANSDAHTLPASLDTNVGGALGTVQAYLEAARVPADWVTSGTDWRTVVRAVAGLYQFAARYTVLTSGDELVVSPAALDLRINQLTTAKRNGLSATADDLGYDRSAIVGTTLVRQALRLLAQQWTGRPFALGGLRF